MWIATVSFDASTRLRLRGTGAASESNRPADPASEVTLEILPASHQQT